MTESMLEEIERLQSEPAPPEAASDTDEAPAGAPCLLRAQRRARARCRLAAAEAATAAVAVRALATTVVGPQDVFVRRLSLGLNIADELAELHEDGASRTHSAAASCAAHTHTPKAKAGAS